MARSFNGSSDYLAIASALGFTVPPMTFFARVKPSALTASMSPICSSGGDSTSFFMLRLAGDQANDPVQSQANQQGVATGTASTGAGLNTTDWHAPAATFTSSTRRDAYLTAANTGSNTTAAVPTTPNRLDVARALGAVSPLYYFAGLMADVAAWNVVLTDAELESLRKGFSPRRIRPQSLKLFLPMVRDTNDRKGNAWTVVGGSVANHPRVYGY